MSEAIVPGGAQNGKGDAGLTERLQACLEMEKLCADLYTYLSKLFTEAGDLFRKLAEDEERHADILTVSLGFHDIGELPDRIVPESPEHIRKSLDSAEDFRRLVTGGRVTLEEVLAAVLDLERSMAESYLHEVMTGETGDDVISYLKQFYQDEKSHCDRVKDYLLRMGGAPAG
jgi:bacterioferritin (cytochrome b1)